MFQLNVREQSCVVTEAGSYSKEGEPFPRLSGIAALGAMGPPLQASKALEERPVLPSEWLVESAGEAQQRGTLDSTKDQDHNRTPERSPHLMCPQNSLDDGGGSGDYQGEERWAPPGSVEDFSAMPLPVGILHWALAISRQRVPKRKSLPHFSCLLSLEKPHPLHAGLLCRAPSP